MLSYRRLHQTNRSRLLASNSRNEFLKIVKAVIDRRRAKNDGQVDDTKTSIVKKEV
jgi:hypothetical protein